MTLPKIKHPTYSVVIPSTEQKITLRPFTVQEEKLLFMARSSENTEDAINAVKQIITNCVQESIDVDKLATFDIEYLFIKLRSKSVGEVVELEYTEPESGELIKFNINLDEIKVKTNPNHKKKFIIASNIGIVMRYPTLNEIGVIGNTEGTTLENQTMDVLKKCIETIYDDDNVYSDFTEKELSDFVDNLPIESMQKIREFFDTMPSVEHEVKIKTKTGKKIEVKLKGLNSFFR